MLESKRSDRRYFADENRPIIGVCWEILVSQDPGQCENACQHRGLISGPCRSWNWLLTCGSSRHTLHRLAQGSGFVELATLSIFERKQAHAGGPWQREDLRQFSDAEFPRHRLGNERPWIRREDALLVFQIAYAETSLKPGSQVAEQAGEQLFAVTEAACAFTWLQQSDGRSPNS